MPDGKIAKSGPGKWQMTQIHDKDGLGDGDHC